MNDGLTMLQVFSCCLGAFFVGWVAGKTQAIMNRAMEIAD